MTAKEFWTDFKSYEEELRCNLLLANIEGVYKPYRLLRYQMDTYCLGLTPKIAAPDKGENKKIIFTISCSGDRDLMLYVHRLLDAAPELEHWEFKALVYGKIDTDPKILSEPFKFENFSIIPKNIKFSVYAWDADMYVFDILLLIPLNLAEIDHDFLDNAFLTIFEELWGECFVAEKINLIFYTHNASSDNFFLDLELLEVCLNSFE